MLFKFYCVLCNAYFPCISDEEKEHWLEEADCIFEKLMGLGKSKELLFRISHVAYERSRNI